jgi:undecaprenyl-diphosphatase
LGDFVHSAGTEHLTFLQAITIGLLQGVSELFPISSLGHSVLVPSLIGGSWRRLVSQESQAESPYLAFIVGLHVATAIALVCLLWRDWIRLIGGFVSSVRHRRVETVYERLSWLIVVSTIPAGIVGLALEHSLRTLFAKPEAAAIFLTINGGILFSGEYLRRRSVRGRELQPENNSGHGEGGTRGIDLAITRHVTVRDASIIGLFQSLALLAGISRSGITMVGGLLRGLDHEQAIRFAFLLATPVILAAGVVKIPDLFGPLGDGIRGQVLAGSAAAFVAALVAAKVLFRWFKTRTLTPFAWYCTIFGLLCVGYFA